MQSESLKRITIEYESGVTILFEGESLKPWYFILGIIVSLMAKAPAPGAPEEKASEPETSPTTLADLLKTEKA